MMNALGGRSELGSTGGEEMAKGHMHTAQSDGWWQNLALISQRKLARPVNSEQYSVLGRG